MFTLIWIVGLIVVFGALAYFRVPGWVWAVAVAGFLGRAHSA